MNPYAIFDGHVRDAVAALVRDGALKPGLDTSRIVVEPPRDASHGDLATNAAMVLAKEAAMKPRELAVMIAAKLVDVSQVTKTEVAGPGFINISVDPAFWREVLKAVLADTENFGHSDLGH